MKYKILEPKKSNSIPIIFFFTPCLQLLLKQKQGDSKGIASEGYILFFNYSII